MNEDINHTLMALVPMLNMNGEKVAKIEAVENWYKDRTRENVEREYCKEVAEITYQNGSRKYADIGGDSNLTAIYDVMAVIQQIKPSSQKIEKIKRNVYKMPETEQ